MVNCILVILTGISMVIGLALLVASGLAIEKYRTGISQCFDKDNPTWFFGPANDRTKVCRPLYAIAGVVCLGILTSAIQIIFNLCALVKRDHGGKLWGGIHALIFLLCIVAFALGFHYFGDENDPWNVFFNFIRDKDINRYLIAINGIDWIFCFIALILANCLPSKGSYRYSRP